MKYLNTQNVPYDLPVVRIPAMGVLEWPTPEVQELIANGTLKPQEAAEGEAPAAPTSSTVSGEGEGGAPATGEAPEGAGEQLTGAAGAGEAEGSGEVAGGAEGGPETAEQPAAKSRKK